MSGRSEELVYLSLGGNIGDPAATMAAALRLLDADARTRLVAVSSLYRTPPWGKLDQPEFRNAAAALRTSHQPRGLLDLCLDIERRLKRERKERWGPRLVDLDILLFGDRRVAEPGLEIPHPRMLDRAFVLVPLAEIAPDLAVEGRPMTVWRDLVDASGIYPVSDDGDWWKSA
ncbi:MAG: 2-amino-4-hydroxy-6-hydroxymethyldihydropteridine diphosphokinase [Rhizobiaceae bacterium]|nr:2-amino-4-hydroxy-6-hydroxymethyldihydropteridine diphosphokinase [Rhizobiaceae bacterium]